MEDGPYVSMIVSLTSRIFCLVPEWTPVNDIQKRKIWFRSASMMIYNHNLISGGDRYFGSRAKCCCFGNNIVNQEPDSTQDTRRPHG